MTSEKDVGPVAEKVMEMLEAIGGVVGETAQDMWPHAVRYMWASGIAKLVFATIITAGIITLFVLLIRELKKWEINSNNDDGFTKALGIAVCTAGIIITICVGAYHATQGLIMVIEPTGATIKMVLQGVL